MTKLEITTSQLNRYLWTRQGFDATDPPLTAQQVIEATPGIHGTTPTCYLSVLARSPASTFADLDDLLYTQRTVVRVRAMRTGLFLLPARQFPDIFQATAHLTRSAFAEIVRNSDVSDDEYAQAASRIEAVLEGATLTLPEIRRALSDLPDRVAAALSYIVGLMCGEGRLVRAGMRGGWSSDVAEYARFRDWLPDVDLAAGDAERGRVLLARRYFEAFGPASADDFHWWSGLSREEADAAVAALRDELVPVSVRELPGELLILAAAADALAALPDEGPRGIRLLPPSDAYTAAYASRARYIQPRWYERIYDRAGNPTYTILRDGRIGGIWDFEERGGRLELKIALFDPADKRTWREIERAAEPLAKALGTGAPRLLRCPPPPPSGAGPGCHRSPLRDVEGEPVAI
jgi:hypothetical protein